MKILENNYDENREVVCSACNSKLLLVPEDIHNDGVNDYYICAACGAHIKIAAYEPSEYFCDKCGKLLPDEKCEGWMGCLWTKCPYCGEDNLVEEGIELTPENVVYPLHFYDTEDASKVSDQTLQEYVREVAARLDKDTDYAFTGTGDSIVFAFKSDPDYSEATVIVARGYHETTVTIPREKF